MKYVNWMGLKMAVAAVAILTVAGTAFAGTRGGGKGVFIGKDIWLSDLTGSGACHSRAGSSVWQDNPYLVQVFQKLSQVDWYFARALKNEILSLHYCFTTDPLQPVNTHDGDSVIMSNDQQGPQIGERILGGDDRNKVYIYLDAFNQGSPRSQAYTIIHETMHDFIPLDVPHRNEDLRSVVLNIADVQDGKENQADFEVALEDGHVQFPRGIVYRQGEEAFYDYVFSDWIQRRNILLSMGLHDFMQLIGRRDIHFFIEALKPEERPPFEHVEHRWYESLVGGFCQDVQIVRELTAPLRADHFDFLQACMNITHDDLATPVKAMYYQSHNFAIPYEAMLAQFAVKSIHVESLRIMGSREIADMSRTGHDSRPVRPLIELEPVTCFDEFHEPLRGYFKTLRALVRDGVWKQVAEATWGDPNFYQTFTIKGYASQIADSQGVYSSEEIPLAVTKFEAVTEAPLRVFIASLDPASAQKFIENIDSSKLGYSLTAQKENAQ